MFCKCLNLIRFQNLRKYSSSFKNIGEIKNTNVLGFSVGDQNTILSTLNQDQHDNWFRLDISHSQIEKLQSWKSKKGPFLSINDVLDVDGIDVKDLAKILKSIVSDEPFTSNTKKHKMKIRQIISPQLSTDTINNLTSVVSIHLGPFGISWSKLSRATQQLDGWDFDHFSDLPPKAGPSEIFELALHVLEDIPNGDIYIFEGSPGIGIKCQGLVGPMIAYTQQVMLSSMLLTLLNTSAKHNRLNNTGTGKIENVIYFLKAQLPARLFQTWVGTEKVSAIKTVEQLFNNTELNLAYSPVHINQSLKEKFNKQSSLYQELMSQSLLLGITFLDLCVYKNPVSIQAISPSKRKKC
ncbi:hypothetical protein WA026_012861 [Henosepilachna vigintioctopunctata]|uniref:Uncharacterized protein n=1 Tax=Henosepilachna vigintioctopunctata TaxID=420089 RepID=A0AAW1TST5_9CUCU